MDTTKIVLTIDEIKKGLKEAQIDEDLQLLDFDWCGYVRDAVEVHVPDAFVRWHLLYNKDRDIYAVTYDDGNGYVCATMLLTDFKKGYAEGEYRDGIPGHIGGTK